MAPSSVQWPGVVHARRDLVDQHGLVAAVTHHEHRHRQYPDIVEGAGDLARDPERGGGDVRRQVGGAREVFRM